MMERDEDVSARPCVVCGAELPNLGDNINQPMGGTAFMSTGHYGSTVFDPMDGSQIELNLCDPCVRQKASGGLIVRYTGGPRVHQKTMTLWRGPREPTEWR